MINPVELSTDDLYYADANYFSVSAYKSFSKCEYSALFPESKKTTPLLVGSYVDRYVEGTLDIWLSEHPECFVSTGKNKGELKAPFKEAQQICEYISNDKVFSQFMSGEKQMVMTGDINGVPWKIKIDSYSPHIAINDLKVMATITDRSGKYIDFITPWGYDIQMAVYQEIVRQNTGELLPCFICAVSKTDPINSVIVNIPQYILDTTLYTVMENAPHYWMVKQGCETPIKCGKCATCLRERKGTPIINLEDIINGL